jgi:hypothetical protein
MNFLQKKLKRVSGIFSGPKTDFQVLSDLNLDYESQYLTFHIPVAAPYLILAGNIGCLAHYDDYLSFLVRRCNLHEKVYLVLGALEFHDISWMEGLQLAHKMEQEPVIKGRLEVLYETRSDVPGTNITLLGCTLWSKIADADTAAVMKKIPEFDEEQGIKEWDIAKHNSEHERDYGWLAEELKKTQSDSTTPTTSGTGRVVIVVTSFSPDLRNALEPWQINAPWTSAYGTDLLDKGDWAGVKMWISGTTGRTYGFEKNELTVMSNQRGRKDGSATGLLPDGMSERQKVGLFDVEKVVKL